jgi:hypothetical protein
MSNVRIEILPGQLAWAPERFSPLDAMAGGKTTSMNSWMHVSALELCGELGGKYQVFHYTKTCLGRAFGPLGIHQTLAFCANLRKALAKAKAKGLGCELRTMPGEEDAHTNTTVMIGAYLILGCGWSVHRVVEALGAAEAQRKFVCSWARADKPEGFRLMDVADCWEGLELARKHGWLSEDLITDDVKLSIWSSTYRRMLTSYDACWLVPGSLLVSADPTTTAFDPNPATFSAVFPDLADGHPCYNAKSSKSGNAGGLDSVMDFLVPGVTPPKDRSQAMLVAGSTSKASSRTNTPPAVNSPARPYDDDNDDVCSTDTVCKDYIHGGGTAGEAAVLFRGSVTGELQTTGKPEAFVSFLQDCKVSLVIRMNYANEPGMRKEYDGPAMLAYGIQHADVSVDDHHGGLPERQSIEAAIETADDFMRKEGEAVLLHCKGGFGRSVVMACCLLIHRLNVPGAALLGWVRLCRPGAVTTPKQEQFLRMMRGREDLRRYLNGSARNMLSPGVAPSPACGCCVQ